VQLHLAQGDGLNPITAVGSGAVYEKHRSALGEIIRKLDERFGEKYETGAIDLTPDHIISKLATDDDLARQAEVNTPEQFAESPALPKAFAKAVVGVRDETPQIVDDMLGDSFLYAELNRAMPAMV
jgi:type I restriction enzyme R subunit